MSSTSALQSAEQSHLAKRKERRNVTRACAHCRARKIKCDGARPTCGTCESIFVDCQYDFTSDGRRAVPKSVTEALQTRVAALEALLTARNISFDEVELLDTIDQDMLHDSSGTLSRQRSWEQLKDADAQLETDQEELNFGIDRLKLDDGQLRQVGPSACFHLPWATPAMDNLVQSVDSQSHITTNLSNTLIQAKVTQQHEQTPPLLYRTDTTILPSPTSSYIGLGVPANVTAEMSTQSLQWSKHLPKIPGFSMAAHDQSLEMFFVHSASWIILLDQEEFRKDMRCCLSTDSSPIWRKAFYSPVLHNAMLANSLGFSDDPSLNTIAIRNLFADLAVQQVHAEVQSPMISTIYGLILLARFYGSSSPTELGYVYSGLALRCAQSLGLGIDCSAFVERGMITSDVKAQRDHAFYVCFILDKLWSFHAGRAAILTMPVHQINMPAAPLASMKDDLTAWNYLGPSDANVDVGVGLRDNRSWKSTTFRELVKLSHIAERILKTVYSVHLNIKSVQVGNIVAEINLSMETWHSSLPKPLRLSPQTKNPTAPPHVLVLHMIYHYLVIMLYRPYDGDSNTGDESAGQKCLRASARIVDVLQIHAISPGLRYASDFVIHITFAAASVQLSQFQKTHSNGNSPIPRDLSSSVNHCIVALQSMGVTWPLAEQFAIRLQNTLRGMANPPSKSPNTSIANMGLKQMLVDRPELADELKAMGWIPPPGDVSEASRPGISSSCQNIPQSIRSPLVNQVNTASAGDMPFPMAPIGTENNWYQDQEGMFSSTDPSFDFLYSLLHDQ